MVAIDMSDEDRDFMESARRFVKANPWMMDAPAHPSGEQALPEGQPLPFAVLGIASGAVAAALKGIAMSPETPFLAGSTAHTIMLVVLLGYYVSLGGAALGAMVSVGKRPNLMWFVAGSLIAAAITQAAPYLA